jgi:hypothetical protein
LKIPGVPCQRGGERYNQIFKVALGISTGEAHNKYDIHFYNVSVNIVDFQYTMEPQ